MKNNVFTSTPVQGRKRNLFDLSHEVKMTGKFGNLYPVLLMDCVPGDIIRDQMTAMVRFAPMLAPIMHRVDVTTHFFFVPNRLLSDGWQEFITGGQDGDSAIVDPYIQMDTLRTTLGAGSAVYKKGSLWDYFGLPVVPAVEPGAFNTERISVYPFRAYAKIFNDWYRDPNFDDELDLDTELQGNVSAVTANKGLLQLRRRGWEKDYFTAALPWAQRGAEVLMPLAGSGTVVWSDDVLGLPLERTAGGVPANGDINSNGGNLRDSAGVAIRPGPDAATAEITTSGVSINDLRNALALQSWAETNARGGGRYIEQIQAHFDVRVPDYRLARAEYLGGGKQPVQISEVLATAGDTANQPPVGDMAGHGISVGKSNQFSYRCDEHGWVLGIMSITPKPAYASQGIDRMWLRSSRYDYAWPELAHIGEQEILSKEIYFKFDSTEQTDNQELFGYLPRFSEYKFKNDRISGDFRDTLAFWHLGRIFTSRPVLDSFFTTIDQDGDDGDLEEPMDRIFAVQDGTDYLWIQLFHKLRCKRPLPYFSAPRLVG